MKTYLASAKIPFEDATTSKTALDFHLTRNNIYFDAKEKAQRFSAKNWGEPATNEEHLCIIDDLAARKILYHAPLSFCLIKNSSVSPVLYHIFSIVDLFCAPKKRVRRPIEKSVKAFKGKWILDLRNAASFDRLADAISYMLAYEKNFSYIFRDHIDCWGQYPSEELRTAGTTRKAIHWSKDASAHT